VFGVRIVTLREARRELAAALKRGEHVGLVADRDVSGGGMEVSFFGSPAPIPIGPAFLAVDAGAPIYLAGIWRTGRLTYRGRLDEIPVSTEGPAASGSRRRSRPRRRLRADDRPRPGPVGGDLLPDLAGSRGRGARVAAGSGRGRRASRGRTEAGGRGVTARLGRADLHIHTLASDGTSGILEILDHVERETDLDVIAITDHERIDAALAAAAISRERGLRAEIVIGEEVTTRGGHLLGLFLAERVRPLQSMRWTIAAIHEQGGLAVPAHPLVPYPLCAQGWLLRRLIADPDPRVRPDAIEAFNPTTLGRPWHGKVVRFAAEQGLPTVGNSDAHAAPRLRPAGRRSRAVRPRTSGRRSSRAGPTITGRSMARRPSSGRSGTSCASTVATRATPRWAGSAATGPRATWATGRPPPAAPARGGARRGAGRTRRSGPVKIGLVSPYVYPMPGGVTQHVGYLYENLRLRGHDVRILTSSHGLQRSSEGDIIRIGKGFSMPVNGSVGTITLSPRFVSQVRDMLEREQFDLPPLP
jgi:hypothetical protein